MRDRHGLLNIILVEDDDGDAKAIRRALTKAGIANPVRRVTDGVEALALLRGAQGAVPETFIILLDLNMPRMNGIEFMAELRSDPALRRAVIFVMTTSRDDRDRADAYDRHVAGYILKSNVGEDFLDLVGTLDRYWHLVELPRIAPLEGA
ncbi:Response regulator receiver domain-containing protein [Roseivivax lentus]|uniref:Response regulator receiver domain-containing protein n=1 Tax=Roseivivax lentus TaxID=633194 RepID=A0A1N7LQU8_9RHOB|nr:response regulator [Roseivivax lentus]SIS76164.1 Response regulator receiver domain-containing protein [Roseivivax lentus]